MSKNIIYESQVNFELVESLHKCIKHNMVIIIPKSGDIRTWNLRLTKAFLNKKTCCRIAVAFQCNITYLTVIL